MEKLKEFKSLSGAVYATVYYDASTNTLIDEWEGVFGSQENFKRVISYIRDFILEKKVTKWLANLREMKGSFDGSKEWVLTQVMPQLIESGLALEAVVIPKNVFAKLSAKDTVLKIENFELRQFDHVEDALIWLNETSHQYA